MNPCDDLKSLLLVTARYHLRRNFVKRVEIEKLTSASISSFWHGVSLTNVMLANQSVMGALDTAGETYLQSNISNLVPEELDLVIF